MRYKKVLLVMPRYRKTHYKTADLPSGLGYISEALNRANIENKVFDLNLNYDKSDLINEIENYQPELIGFSMLSFGYRYNYNLIKDIKHKFKKISIVLGGPHISTLRGKVLEECPEIDYGILLEGEESIVELCRDKLGLSAIKGLLYRQDGKVAYTGERPWIEDIDGIGFPKFSRFEMDKYESGIPISTSRGCAHLCIYCPVQTAIGKTMRVRSPKSVVDEIEYWHNRGLKIFGITDDNFTFLPERVYQICQEIKRRQLKSLTLACGNGIRADRVNRVLLSEMKEVGFKHVSFGVESGNDHILKRLKKGERLSDIETAIKDACDIGLAVTLFFLLGSPGETKEDLQRSLDLALRYPIYDARFYNIIPFPGTELFEWVKNNNYFVRDTPDYLNRINHWVNEPIFFTPELSAQKRRKLYFQLNRILKVHTLKVKRTVHIKQVEKKFLETGLPYWLSIFLAKVYYSRLLQLHLVNTAFMYNLKRWFKKIKHG